MIFAARLLERRWTRRASQDTRISKSASSCILPPPPSLSLSSSSLSSSLLLLRTQSGSAIHACHQTRQRDKHITPSDAPAACAHKKSPIANTHTHSFIHTKAPASIHTHQHREREKKNCVCLFGARWLVPLACSSFAFCISTLKAAQAETKAETNANVVKAQRLDWQHTYIHA